MGNWTGPAPKKCELCGGMITDIFIDGHVKYRGGFVWGNVCPILSYLTWYWIGDGKRPEVRETNGRYIQEGRGLR